MISQNYNVIGVMSGTSLDGIDLLHIIFTFKQGKWGFKMHEAETISYTEEWVERLKVAMGFSASELVELNREYTVLLASVINTFIENHSIRRLDAVCSHGHTILHQPEAGITLQIGNLESLSAMTGQKIVCDFRVQDVAIGGQGAPLVPIGDRLLFAEYGYCLNLGGFSNISFEENCRRIAFDICPVNTVLNFYAARLGYEYDDRGNIARQGKVVPDLLNELNNLDFYKQQYPKSLGYEFVKIVVLPLVEKFSAAAEDKLRTFTEHIAMQITSVIKGRKTTGNLLITGGGAYNDFLVDRLREMLPETAIVIPDDKTIQYKEALIFGLLGVLKVRGDINVLGTVTGASQDHSSGNIFLP